MENLQRFERTDLVAFIYLTSGIEPTFEKVSSHRVVFSFPEILPDKLEHIISDFHKDTLVPVFSYSVALGHIKGQMFAVRGRV